jgi:hypothetical protein
MGAKQPPLAQKGRDPTFPGPQTSSIDVALTAAATCFPYPSSIVPEARTRIDPFLSLLETDSD